MATMITPPAGDIPLHLGNSFYDPHHDPSYWSLRYDFKPASMNTEAPGTLRMNADNQVSLDLLNKSGGNGELGFSGHSERYDGLDCVATFDGSSWRLQLLTGSLKVRHVKGPSRASPAPQALPAAVHEIAGTQLPTSSMDAVTTQTEAEDWFARDLSQEASKTHPSDNVMAADAVSSDRQSDTEDEDDGLVQQSTDTDMLDPSVNHLHHETNGHTDPSVEAHQSSDASEEDSEDEEGDAGNELGNKEADMQQEAPVITGAPMSDLERQFFANSQSPSSESSDSSSDSEQESLNAASEDDEDDGLDHF